jgi:hypothetical protein
MVGASFSTRKQDANIGRERDQQGVAYLKLALVEVYGEGRSAMPERSPCEIGEAPDGTTRASAGGPCSRAFASAG